MNRARIAAALRELAAGLEEDAPVQAPGLDDPGLTLKAAGELLGSKADPVHPSTVSRMVKRGVLKAIPCGQAGIRVLQSSILDLKKKAGGPYPRRVAS